jgi:hypothetical protein
VEAMTAGLGIGWAVQTMEAGTRVRRASWPPLWWMSIDDGHITIHDGDGRQWLGPGSAGALAKDWGVAG